MATRILHGMEFFELENVFVKHYAPNCTLDPKVEWSLLEYIEILMEIIRSSSVNLLIIFNQQTKIQVPKSNAFQGILLASLKC